MDSTAIAAIVTAVCTALASIIATVAATYTQWKKPLSQAQESLNGIATVATKVSATLKEYNTLVAEARAQNNGKLDTADLAVIITKLGDHYADIAAYISNDITQVRNAGSTIVSTSPIVSTPSAPASITPASNTPATQSK